jgi:hypothetical protein
MNRIELVNKLIERKQAKIYLEIGVDIGNCFLKIKAPVKIGVDPRDRIPFLRKLKYYIKNTYNYKNKFIQLTSDDYFDRHEEFLKKEGLDVVLIDGLHTHEQTIKDVRNSLKYLNPNGIIVLHDCNPLSEAAAFPTEDVTQAYKVPGYAGIWNGDVWKTIALLRSTRDDLDIMVLNCDNGLGVIKKGTPENKLNLGGKDIKNLSYKDLDSNRKEYLNLKNEDSFVKVIDRLTKSN